MDELLHEADVAFHIWWHPRKRGMHMLREVLREAFIQGYIKAHKATVQRALETGNVQ